MITTVLAIARLTSLITEDEITQPIRDYVDDLPHNVVTDKLAYLVSCKRCVSVWATAAVLVAHKKAPFLVKVLAGSQAALFVLATEGRL